MPVRLLHKNYSGAKFHPHSTKGFFIQKIMQRDKPGPRARPATATATTTASLALFKDPEGCPFIAMFQHRGGGVEELKLNSPDPSSSKLGTIQLVQSILHVAATPKLSNSLSTPVLMSVCVVDFACLAHEVL